MDTGQPTGREAQLYALQDQVKDLQRQLKKLRQERDQFRADRDSYAARLAEAQQKSRFASLDATVARDNQSEATQELQLLRAQKKWLQSKQDRILECINMYDSGRYEKADTIYAITEILEEEYE